MHKLFVPGSEGSTDAKSQDESNERSGDSSGDDEFAENDADPALPQSGPTARTDGLVPADPRLEAEAEIYIYIYAE